MNQWMLCDALWCSVQIKLGPNLVLWQTRLVLSEAVPRRCLRLALKVNLFLQKMDDVWWFSIEPVEAPRSPRIHIIHLYIYIIIYTYIENYTVISCLPGLYFVHRVLQNCVVRHLPHQHIWNISTFSVIAKGSLMLCGYPLPSLNMAGVACQGKKMQAAQPLRHHFLKACHLACEPSSLDSLGLKRH